MKTLVRLAGAALVLIACAQPAAAQDAVGAARDLYGSAAYDEALALLDRIKGSGQPGDVRVVEQYRALCLLALGRQAEAERAIELLFAADPAYRVDAAASPRVQSAFSSVRRRVLPSLVQQRYLHAKAAYDRKEYEAAIAQFDATLALLEMPEVMQGQEAAFSDMRTLITGFRDLARAAMPPPPPPKPAAAPEPVAPPAPVRKPFYTADDTDVTAPAVVSQKMPRWEGPAAQAMKGMKRRGVIEVTIGESGAVESVVMRQPTSTVFDDMLLAEARKWQYRPAKKDGAPVKYRKLIQFTLE
ncbi:MAG: TonB family protein [Acidobacteria bacterium]|nr:MAG: TonB family protein [Acidobacteriota bacterium]